MHNHKSTCYDACRLVQCDYRGGEIYNLIAIGVCILECSRNWTGDWDDQLVSDASERGIGMGDVVYTQ